MRSFFHELTSRDDSYSVAHSRGHQPVSDEDGRPSPVREVKERTGNRGFRAWVLQSKFAERRHRLLIHSMDLSNKYANGVRTSEDVGSSASKSFGSRKNARASATRCLSPPLNREPLSPR